MTEGVKTFEDLPAGQIRFDKKPTNNPNQPLLAALAAAIISTAVAAEDKLPDLENGFKNPPNIARPGVYWFFMNGNITREGIDFDLKAMKQAGLAEAMIYSIGKPEEEEMVKLLGVKDSSIPGYQIPDGPVRFGSEKWIELMDYAVTKAKELGLELGMHNSPGFCGAAGPWVTPEHAQRCLAWSETVVKGPGHIEVDLPTASSFLNRRRSLPGDDSYRDVAVVAFAKSTIEPCSPEDARLDKALFSFALFDVPARLIRRIPKDAVVDLTGKMDETGRLRWEAPEGEWVVQRFGHASTGGVNHPAPYGGFGLPIDHYSRAATLHHWKHGIQPLLDKFGDKVGTSFNYLTIDSIEGHDSNWTENMPAEFARRRGYSIVPFLPVLAGTAVGDVDLSNRFLADFRSTRSDL